MMRQFPVPSFPTQSSSRLETADQNRDQEIVFRANANGGVFIPLLVAFQAPFTQSRALQKAQVSLTHSALTLLRYINTPPFSLYRSTFTFAVKRRVDYKRREGFSYRSCPCPCSLSRAPFDVENIEIRDTEKAVCFL